MQRNVKPLSDGSNEIFDGRRNSLDIPSHGHVPTWLEDMASSVERSHSLIMEKEYLTRQEEDNNNDSFTIYSPNQHLYSNSNSGRHSTESTPSSSAKYGRRSSLSLGGTTPLKQQQQHQQDYIVPKLERINLKQISEAQYDTINPIFTNNVLQQQSSLEDDENVYEERYSPSILNMRQGRRSRMDATIDQLTSSFKDISLNDSQHFPKNIHSNPVPEPTKNIHKSFIPLDDKLYPINYPKKNENLNSYLQGHEDPLDRKITFEEDFLALKQKIQRYKKRKSQKHKLHNQNLVAMRRDYYSDLPGNFEEKCTKINDDSQELFIIPELPTGTMMIVDILSTWGDRYYVGLNGVELFDSDGNLVQVRKISACPEDINILPECNGDPRVVTNLLDGINRTQDDMHLWLTPFDSGEHHLITMEFYKKTELAMIRIWNYNKSRIHSYRGARDVVITLDGVCIFRGEIAQACGSILGGIETFGDTILFTTDEAILERIAFNDISFTTLMNDKEVSEKTERPSTATADEDMHQRPYTHAFSQKSDASSGDQLYGAQRLDIILTLNWGKSDYIGLTGLELIGDSDIPLTIPRENLRSNDITVSAMLSRLIDNENITCDRKHMWFTQFILGEEIVISMYFDDLTYIAGIRFWNYNENLEMTFCGVRMIKIFLDNKPMINQLTNDTTFYLRRAPGNTHYDYVQEIRFSQHSLINIHPEPCYDLNHFSAAKEEQFENPLMPEGFVFQIVIYTTWGDQYYVGLNGIEIFDQHGKKIVLTESNICAHPESVNILPGVSGDVRTPDKLVDGINDRSDGTHSWLVPVIPKCLNRIYIVFDQPVAISVIKIWNYLKSPTRGVKEFGILVDDLLIYNGILDKISDKSAVKHRTILFTNNTNVLQKEMASLVKHSIDSQATILTNDEPRVTTGGSLPNVDQSLRPFTSVNYLSRGRTSQSN